MGLFLISMIMSMKLATLYRKVEKAPEPRGHNKRGKGGRGKKTRGVRNDEVAVLVLPTNETEMVPIDNPVYTRESGSYMRHGNHVYPQEQMTRLAYESRPPSYSQSEGYHKKVSPDNVIYSPYRINQYPTHFNQYPTHFCVGYLV